MKKLIYLFAILAFTFACSSQKEDTSESEETTETEEESIYNYSSSLEMGDKSIQQATREMINAFATNDMETVTSMMADSVSFYFANGYVYKNTRDSAVAMISEYRSSLSSVDVIYLAGMAVDATDHGHNWGLSWTRETHTGESTLDIVYHEAWLFENGKITSMRQFASEPNEADSGELPEELPEYTYSGSFEAGDPAHVDVVIGLQEAAQAKDMAAMTELFADSVTIVGHDGFYFNSSRDSLMSMAEKWFANMQEINIDYNSAIAVTSTDQSEDWVLLYFEENSTNNDGEITHQFVHDDYLIVDNKIRAIRGYVMKIADEE